MPNLHDPILRISRKTANMHISGPILLIRSNKERCESFVDLCAQIGEVNPLVPRESAKLGLRIEIWR